MSHENAQLNADSSDSDTNDIEGGKHSQTNEEEKEDMLALEENCKLEIYHTILAYKVNFMKKQPKFFQLLQEKEANQYHC